MSHHHENIVPLFDQKTRKLCGFVRCDRSSDAQHDRLFASGNIYHFAGFGFLQFTSGILFHGIQTDQFRVSRLLKNVSADIMLRTFPRSSSTEPLTIV